MAQQVVLLALSLGALLAFLTAWRAHAANRLAGSPSLRWFEAGFFLLGVAQLAALLLQVLIHAAPVALERGGPDHFDVLFWAHYASLLAGLACVFRSFGRRAFRWTPALGVLLLQAGPVLQLLTVVVLFFVVLHSGLNHIARGGAGSRLVSVGFFLMLLAHIGNLTDYAPLEPRLWWAELLNVSGLVILYLSVPKPRMDADA